MAWMVTTAGLFREQIKVCFRRDMAEIRITVVGCGSLHLFIDEAKQLLEQLDSACAEADASEFDPEAEDRSGARRAELMLLATEAG